MHVLVVGCGWLGKAIGVALRARGDRVSGVRRTEAGASELRTLGIEPIVADLSDWHAVSRIPGDVEAIVACQSAGGDSPEAYQAAYVETNRNLLQAARRLPLRAFVYTSSTGVFGQQDGSTVDEDTPPSPTGTTAEILVEAEGTVLGSMVEDGQPTRVVRLSGLYGPGRTGILDRVREGKLALGPGDETWMNFCHLDDAVTAVLAALDRGRPGAIYHATDASPARRREVVEWISGRLGIRPPRLPYESDRPPGGRRGAHRRISGERTRAALGLTLVYPSFREGLAPWLPGATPPG